MTFVEGDTASHDSIGTRQTTQDSFVLVESPTIEQAVPTTVASTKDIDAELLVELNALNDKGVNLTFDYVCACFHGG